MSILEDIPRAFRDDDGELLNPLPPLPPPSSSVAKAQKLYEMKQELEDLANQQRIKRDILIAAMKDAVTPDDIFTPIDTGVGTPEWAEEYNKQTLAYAEQLNDSAITWTDPNTGMPVHIVGAEPEQNAPLTLGTSHAYGSHAGICPGCDQTFGFGGTTYQCLVCSNLFTRKESGYHSSRCPNCKSYQVHPAPAVAAPDPKAKTYADWLKAHPEAHAVPPAAPDHDSDCTCPAKGCGR